MNGRLRALLVILCTGLALLLTACDTGSDKNEPDLQLAPPPTADTNAAQAVDYRTWSDTGSGQESGTTASGLIIKNGDMSLLVDDIDATLDAISGIAVEYGGYVLRTSANRTGVNTATVTIAVEADHFEDAIQSIRGTALEVLNESTTGEDVTAEYVDLDSRMRNLEATRDRLRGFLDEAQNVEEALSVNTELSRIEGEIEQVKGRMNYLTGRAAYSTITITLREPSPETPKSDKGWSLGRTFDNALEAQRDTLRFLANLLIWLVVFAGPYVLIVGVIAWGWWRWRQRPGQTSE
jgi:hypothetical protein